MGEFGACSSPRVRGAGLACALLLLFPATPAGAGRGGDDDGRREKQWKDKGKSRGDTERRDAERDRRGSYPYDRAPREAWDPDRDAAREERKRRNDQRERDRETERQRHRERDELRDDQREQWREQWRERSRERGTEPREDQRRVRREPEAEPSRGPPPAIQRSEPRREHDDLPADMTSVQRAQVLRLRADALRQAGDLRRALGLLREVLQLQLMILLPDNPAVQRTRKDIDALQRTLGPP